MSEKKIIIFDGNCPYCMMASVTVENLNDNIKIIEWQDESSQNFLQKQFNNTPFNMVFVDSEKDSVWVGDKAVKEIADRSRVTKPFKSLLLRNYDKIASFVGFLSRRENDYDREYYGLYKLEDEAEEIMGRMYEDAEGLSRKSK